MLLLGQIPFGAIASCLVAIGIGIGMVSLARYTRSVTGKYKEGAINGLGLKVVTKVSYTVDGVNYLWTAKYGDVLYPPTQNPVVDVTDIQLYYNPKDPSDASYNSNNGLLYSGYAIAILGAIAMIAVIGFTIYDSTLSNNNDALRNAQEVALIR